MFFTAKLTGASSASEGKGTEMQISYNKFIFSKLNFILDKFKNLITRLRKKITLNQYYIVI
jgi:hypothetical protein